MTGYWRDTASEEAQFQMDTLLGSALLAAEALVKKHAEFYPFAFAWPTGAGEPDELMALDDLETEHPDSTVIIERTLKVLRDRREGLDATALVTDVYLGGSPAINVDLEHRDGIHFAISRHYRPRRWRRGAALASLDGHHTEPQVWGG